MVTDYGPQDSEELPSGEQSGGSIFLLVDMDSFFASIEVVDNPGLSGKPVVVGADPHSGTGRGVVSTCSYEARAYGIHSAMPIRDAFHLCPTAIFLPVRMDRYEEVSGIVMSVISSIAPVFIPQSIDEALVILPASLGYRGAENLARRIKVAVRAATSLTCSVGVGQSKVVAKIASGRCKPDGLLVIHPEETRAFLSPLPVREIPGVGEKTAQVLAAHGILLVRDLLALGPTALTSLLGSPGADLFQMAGGLDPAVSEGGPSSRSIGRETTFPQDTTDPYELITTMRSLAEEASLALREEGLVCRTIGIKVRYTGFITRSRARTLSIPTDDTAVVTATACDLLRRMTWEQGIRLLGIRLSGLRTLDPGQKKLHDFAW